MRPRVLFFGTYDHIAGRTGILIEGLRAVGLHVTECRASLWSGTAEKVAAVRSPARSGIALLRLASAWRALLAAHASAGDYDVMLVGPTAHLDLPLARLLATRRGRTLVFDPLVSITETARDRGLLAPGSLRLASLASVERALFKLPDLCLADTQAHAAAFAHLAGLPPERFAVLPVGAPSVYRRSARAYSPETANGRVRVLYCGQFIPLHGLETVLHAASLLRGRPEISFELVGTGQLLPYVQDLAIQLELANVGFRPVWLTPEELVEDHISRADICLGVFGRQPKAARVVPYKVYAGLACGRPVLTGHTPAVLELLRVPDEAWTVACGSPAELAEAISKLAAMPDERRRLAAAGRRAFDERFAPAVLGARLAGMLGERCGVREEADE